MEMALNSANNINMKNQKLKLNKLFLQSIQLSPVISQLFSAVAFFFHRECKKKE